MLDATNLPDKSFVKVNIPRIGTGSTRRHMTPEPYMSKMRALNKHIQYIDSRANLIFKEITTSHKFSEILKSLLLALEEEVNVDEKKEVSANLTGLKKKFDETRESRYKKEKEINWMRIEIDKLKVNEQFMKDEFGKSNEKLAELIDGVETQKLRIEEASHRRSSYLHVLDRAKKDKIIDQLKVRELKEIVNKEAYDLNQEEANARKARQFHLQTRLVFDDVIKEVELEERKRQQSLVVFENALNSKEDVERKREDRIKRTQDIAENAAAEIRDSNERKWRELLMVHRFLASFLKKKMDREMKQYEVVERAFQKIKASTGLADAKEIVNKFIKKEDTYSELLISIASYEKKIAELKRTNDTYTSRVSSLVEKNAAFEKHRAGKHAENQELLDSYKDLHAKIDTYKEAKLKIEKVHEWSIRNLLKIDKAQQITRHNYYDMYPKEKVVESFLGVIDSVKSQLYSAEGANVERVLDEIETTRIEDINSKEFAAKNIRVKSNAMRADRAKPTESSVNNSRANISRDGSDHEGGRRGDKSVDEDDDEDTNNYLNEQRLGIKAKRQEELLRKKRNKEKEDEEKEREGQKNR